MQASDPSVSRPSIRPGDHLITPRRGYTHHGIYVGRGRVVHYAGLSCGLHAGPVEEVSLEKFAGEHGYTVCRSRTRYAAAVIVRRARSRLGENRYSLVSNNCEHFCLWVRSGEARSEQVERWVQRVDFWSPMISAARNVARLPVGLAGFVRAR